MSTADQCRALGLRVGDTIFGREEGGGGYWHEARLTLLWLGREEAMWSVRERSDHRPEWTEPREGGDWTLDGRDWQKVSTAGVTERKRPASGATLPLPPAEPAGSGGWCEMCGVTHEGPHPSGVPEVATPEPVGEVVMFGVIKEVSWRKGKLPEVGTKLYAQPPADGVSELGGQTK